MLDGDPDKRPTAFEVLQHPWMSGQGSSLSPLASDDTEALDILASDVRKSFSLLDFHVTHGLDGDFQED
jgi:hypothetical protein